LWNCLRRWRSWLGLDDNFLCWSGLCLGPTGVRVARGSHGFHRRACGQAGFEHEVIDGDAERGSPKQQRAGHHDWTEPARSSGRRAVRARAQSALHPLVGGGRQGQEPPVAFQQCVGQSQAFIAPADRGCGLRLAHGDSLPSVSKSASLARARCKRTQTVLVSMPSSEAICSPVDPSSANRIKTVRYFSGRRSRAA